MFYDVKTVAQKIDSYFAGNISMGELGFWAKERYSDLLYGNFVYIKKLYVYFFLRKLSTCSTIPNELTGEYPCSLSEIKEIHNILCGSANGIYKTAVKLDPQIISQLKSEVLTEEKKTQFQRLSTIIKALCVSSPLLAKDKVFIKDFLSQQRTQPETLFEYIELCISALLSDPSVDLIDLPYVHESGLLFGHKIDKSELFQKILMLIDYYLGNVPFRVYISFFSGHPNLTII